MGEMAGRAVRHVERYAPRSLAAMAARRFQMAERRRIQRHFIRVEGSLWHKDVSHLAPSLQHARLRNIEVLAGYRQRGVFPKNTDFPGERVPYFRDARGVSCAVAFLMEASGSGAAVAAIANADNHVRVPDVRDGPLMDWLAVSGMTQEEAARIQPTYDWYPQPPPSAPPTPPVAVPPPGIGSSPVVTSWADPVLIQAAVASLLAIGLISWYLIQAGVIDVTSLRVRWSDFASSVRRRLSRTVTG